MAYLNWYFTDICTKTNTCADFCISALACCLILISYKFTLYPFSWPVKIARSRDLNSLVTVGRTERPTGRRLDSLIEMRGRI